MTRFDRGLYAVTLTAAAVATACLIAPVSYHRIVFRKGRKPQLVRAGSVLASLGLVCLLVAMLGAVFLAVDIVLGVPLAAGVVAVLAALYAFLWYVLPVLHQNRG